MMDVTVYLARWQINQVLIFKPSTKLLPQNIPQGPSIGTPTALNLYLKPIIASVAALNARNVDPNIEVSIVLSL